MRNRTLAKFRIGCLWIVLLSGCGTLFADEVDPSKLPPPATNKIDFTRDIRPILETSCLRCHGPEKPKSRFRLDNRDDALKGGEKGVDLITGDSAKSPLIHYVAYLVEDSEMPPIGKGDQLKPEQIALLRAWIDQGVVWDAITPANTDVSSVEFIFGGTGVIGDSHKYREHYWQRTGPNGGLENLALFDSSVPHTRVAITGHAVLDDYKVGLTIDRNELGFVHAGFEQYRKYYDDTGGYRPSPSTSVPLGLGRDLYLDIGKAWVDFGLTLPDWPRMTLGYEYDYKRGNEATTMWNAYGAGADARNTGPSSKEIQEGVHILKFDLDSEIKGVAIEERFRGEFYRLKTHYTNSATRGPITENVTEGNNYFQGANTIRLERQLTSWLLGSAGYLYSKLDAGGTFQDTVVYNSIVPFVSDVPQIVLERESHVFNGNALIGPFDGLTISAGVQSEWTHQHGFGSGTLNRITFSLGAPTTLAVNPASLYSDYNENSVMEKVAIRYTRIPFTVLFAEGRLEQQTIGQTDNDLQASGNYINNPSFSSRLTDMRVGFSTSPWRSVSLSAHYRRYENDSNYRPNDNTQPASGYPGFIRSRGWLTDEIETKLVLRPYSWLKPSLSCQFLNTRSWVDTLQTSIAPPVISPGGSLLGGQSDSRVYSAGVTWIPSVRLYLDTTFSYQTSTTTSATAGSPAIAPYKGDTYSAIANATYVLSPSSDLFAGYVFSRADYGQNLGAAGVPVGIQYQMHSAQIGLTHRLSPDVSTRLQYRFNYYAEPSSGAANNYRAHTVFVSLMVKLR